MRAGPPARLRRLGDRLLAMGTVLAALSPLLLRPLPEAAASGPRCPKEMVLVGSACVDRYEAHLVDDKTNQPLSPFYPPEPRLLRFAYDYWSIEASRQGSESARKVRVPDVPEVQRGSFSPRAVSAPGVLPQGYMSYYVAERSCQAAGKRLCSEAEWTRACRSGRGTKHPYGDTFQPGRCNVFRNMHPAFELHGNSSVGHLDPRLHLVSEEGETPMLFATGALATCASKHGDDRIFDMVGNLDEWIAVPEGTFVGGFYSRGTREGCESKIENHGPAYADYSLGVRCCKNAQ